MAGRDDGDAEDFHTDAQGRIRPITGKKKGGSLVVAAVLAGAVATSGALWAAPASGEPNPAVLDGAAEVAAWFPPS